MALTSPRAAARKTKCYKKNVVKDKENRENRLLTNGVSCEAAVAT